MYKQDLALNNLQGLIYHKTQLTYQHSIRLITTLLGLEETKQNKEMMTSSHQEK